MRKFAIGCVGLVVLLVGGLVMLAVATSGRPRASAALTPTPAAVGDVVAQGRWEVQVLRWGDWEVFSSRPPSTPPQGRYVVVEFAATNRHQETSNFTTNDLRLLTGDGRRFAAAAASATIDNGVFISQSVQPGLTTTNRIVFDVDPAAENLVVEILGIRFQLE